MTGPAAVATHHYSEVIAELVEPTASLRDATPEAWAGFGQLHGGIAPRASCDRGQVDVDPTAAGGASRVYQIAEPRTATAYRRRCTSARNGP